MNRQDLPLRYELEPTPGPLVFDSRAALIIAGYAFAFFGLLPFALWRLGGHLDVWLRLPTPALLVRLWLGSVLAVGGAAFMARAMWSLLRKGRGLPISHLPPQRLVSSDAFAVWRHPIYVGYTVAVAGIGLGSGSFGRGLLVPALLTLGWLAYAAGLEEPILMRRFGEDYAAYAARTSRLPLPFTPYLRAAWSWCRPWAQRAASSTVLFSVGSAIWVTFGAFLSLGAVLSAATGMALLSGLLPRREIDEYILGTIVTMQIGARLAWLAYQHRALRHAPASTLRRVGFVSFGSYAAMFAFSYGWWLLRARELNAWALADRTMVACSISSAFGRLGCFTYGCCYGRAWAHGIRWLDPCAKLVRERGAAGHEPRFPTQLLSAGWAFVIFALGLGLIAREAPPGIPLTLTMFVYALGRFGLESLRDEERILGERLTRGQLLSACIAGAALAILLARPATDPAPPFRFEASEPLHHLPTLLLVALLVFAVAGYHRRAVGQW